MFRSRSSFPVALLHFALCILPSELFAEKLRVATYNVENYNLTNRMTEDGFARNAPKPEKQKDALRAVIRAMNADVLAVQEIGGAPFTEELRRDLASEGLSYPHAATLDGPDPHRKLAILSKRPFASVTRHARLQTDFDVPSPGERTPLVNRGLLGVTLTVEGRPVRLYTVHLKSRLTRDKRDPRAERERLAESDAVKARLIGDGLSAPDALALLVGDFNDGPHAATLTRFEKTAAGAPFLVRLDAGDAAGESWTYRNVRKGFYDRSDYAFVTPALKPFVTRSRALDHPRTAQASDHRPVVVDLDIPGAGPSPAR